MDYLQKYTLCSFCEFVENELQQRELEPLEALMYRHHMKTEHGMVV